MRPLPQAQRDVLAGVPVLAPVVVGLDHARGAVLAEDVTAPHDVPPFANSAMDGFAVVGSDVATAPVDLHVLEDVAAGHLAASAVRSGSAIRIMTGAPLPAGADTVVRVEDTRSSGSQVTVLVETPVGTAVRPAGGDLRSGALVFAAGTELTPLHLGVLATIGVATPSVIRRPVVGLMSTGDEVVAPATETLEPGKIRDANRPLLRGLLADMGLEVRDYGIIGDDPDLLRGTLHRAAAECDAIVTSGGVSMGDYDLVKQVLTELGSVELWKVAMQPAKPFAFGTIDGRPLFGLPGNPVSVVVAFENFVRPALLKMQGSERLFRPLTEGVWGEDVETDPSKTVFLRVARRGGSVFLTGGQESNVLSATAAAEALAVVEAGVGSMRAGDRVPLLEIRLPAARTHAEVLG
jgi:molybdopterin molybdotransferase